MAAWRVRRPRKLRRVQEAKGAQTGELEASPVAVQSASLVSEAALRMAMTIVLAIIYSLDASVQAVEELLAPRKRDGDDEGRKKSPTTARKSLLALVEALCAASLGIRLFKDAEEMRGAAKDGIAALRNRQDPPPQISLMSLIAVLMFMLYVHGVGSGAKARSYTGVARNAYPLGEEPSWLLAQLGWLTCGTMLRAYEYVFRGIEEFLLADDDFCEKVWDAYADVHKRAVKGGDEGDAEGGDDE